MNRRDFMKVAAASVLAASTDGVNAKVFGHSPADADTINANNTTSADDKGIAVRFLGTGAADWNGPDSRGEHRRLSSILIDRHILIDFTPTNVEMLPEGCTPDIAFYTHSHGDHYNPEVALKTGIKRVYLSKLGMMWPS